MVRRFCCLMFFTALLAGAMPSPALADEKLRVLIVDGQNNHLWLQTTPIIQQILLETDRFTVDVSTTPRLGDNMQSFRPTFSNYDVVVSNYNGDPWPKETQQDFVTFVKQGGGFVSIHAADNAFPDWPEYNQMIGVGGWGGRRETAGPYVYLRDGEVVRDNRPGPGGTHGARRPFAIDLRGPEHPITSGLPRRWMHSRDELYGLLRGPAENMTVLATALSKPKKYDPTHEPMLMTIRFGEGRVFHTTLGHNADAMRCVGFRFTLQRGAEWTATGKVTQTSVPENFPSEDAVSVVEKTEMSEELKQAIANERAARKATIERRKRDKP